MNQRSVAETASAVLVGCLHERMNYSGMVLITAAGSYRASQPVVFGLSCFCATY